MNNNIRLFMEDFHTLISFEKNNFLFIFLLHNHPQAFDESGMAFTPILKLLRAIPYSKKGEALKPKVVSRKRCVQLQDRVVSLQALVSVKSRHIDAYKRFAQQK